MPASVNDHPAEVPEASDSAARRRTPWPLALHPVLAATVPVLVLWAGNIDDVVPEEAIRVIGLAAVVGLVAYVAVRIGLRRSWMETALVSSPTILVLSMANQVPDSVPNAIPIAVAVAVPAIALYLCTGRSWIVQRRLAIVMTVVLVSVTVANGLVIATGLPEPAAANLVDRGSSTAVESTDGRDVWLIVPDRYASLEALDRRGIDGRDFTTALEERGFDVLDDATANYPQTLLSLSSAWNLELYDPTGQSSFDLGPTARESLETPLFGSRLRDAGYQYAHLGSWPGSTSAPSNADIVLTLPGSGEFTETWVGATVLGAAFELTGRGLKGDTRQVRHATHQLEVMHELADRPDGSDPPLLLISHVILPHEPYVFAADGSPQPDPEESDLAYNEQRQFLDDQLLAIIDELQARDVPPIIVIASDEGIYPEGWTGTDQLEFDWSTTTLDDARDKLRILAAVYDPDPLQDPEFDLREDVSLVNLMRWLTNRTAGTDYAELPDRHWIFEGTGPTDLQPIDLEPGEPSG